MLLALPLSPTSVQLTINPQTGIIHMYISNITDKCTLLPYAHMYSRVMHLVTSVCMYMCDKNLPVWFSSLLFENILLSLYNMCLWNLNSSNTHGVSCATNNLYNLQKPIAIKIFGSSCALAGERKGKKFYSKTCPLYSSP